MNRLLKPPTILLGLLLPALILTGCQSWQPRESDDLYQQLGQRSGIEAIVEDLLYLVVEDERINESFADVDVVQFHERLSDQLCELSGGPCTYTGRNMRELHAHMNVTDTQFNALAENLILAMEQNGVPTGAQNRLLEKLIPMYPDIRNL